MLKLQSMKPAAAQKHPHTRAEVSIEALKNRLKRELAGVAEKRTIGRF